VNFNGESFMKGVVSCL